MAKKNSIFSGKPYDPKEPDLPNNWTYTPRVNEEFWSSYYEKSKKTKAANKIRYANKLAKQGTTTYQGKTVSGEQNRMRYLMEQLDKDERQRLRKGIYDDSKTQRAIAEKIIQDGYYNEEEIKEMKMEAMDMYGEENVQQHKKRKLPPSTLLPY